MKEIPLTKGYVALVDDEDYDLLTAIGKWQANVTRRNVYAIHSMKGRRVYMHRLLMLGAGRVDHVNNNGLDNRRANLREVTSTQNAMNMRTKKSAPTEYKGVARHKSRIHPWLALIRVDGRQVRLGLYSTPEEAARAYDAAAMEHFGEFARLNFPKEHAAWT